MLSLRIVITPMASLLSNDLIEFLSDRLKIDKQKLCDEINAFLEKGFKKNFEQEQHSQSFSTSQDDDEKSHYCVRTLRGKKESCGKVAKFCIIDGTTKKWYCGTEKSGCYKIMSGSKQTTSPNTLTPQPPPEKVKVKRQPLKDKMTQDTVKTDVLKKAIAKINKISVKKIDFHGETKWMDPTTRILFDKDNNDQAYGKLNTDGKTVDSLSSDDIRWLETHNCNIKTSILEEKVEKEPKNTDSFESEEDFADVDFDE